MVNVVLAPLLGLLTAEGLLAALLCAPIRPLQNLAADFVRGWSRGALGRTVLMMLLGALFVVFVASMYEGSTVRSKAQQTPDTDEGRREALMLLQQEIGIEQGAILSAAAMVMSVVVYSYAGCVRDGRGLRQDVRQLKAERDKLVSELTSSKKSGARAAPNGTAKDGADKAGGFLNSLIGSKAPDDTVKGLKKELEDAKVEKEKAAKSKAQARAEVEAMRSQTKNLASEYDRLLAENSRLIKEIAEIRGTPPADKKGQ
ncbi:unnamed protein product [Pedinophyceae sp. YPF-701]|nr:unnamed protein product [Pedinophyceae sp. YPF-701]